MVHKQRAVIVMPTYLPESYGGAEQQAHRFAQAITELGASVTILAPRLSPATKKTESEGRVNIRRFRLFHAPNLGGRHMLSFALWSWNLALWLVINRKNYDVIHVFHGRLHAVPAILAAGLLHKPALVKLGRGGADFDISNLGRKRVWGGLMAYVVRQFTTVFVANSNLIVRDLQAAGVEDARIRFIPNGIGLPPDLETPRARSGPCRLVYLGRLDPEKNLKTMIEAFARLDPESARLTIVGDGQCRGALEKLAQGLGVTDRVKFIGAVDNVFPYLNQADYFVSTSESEGMSNALLEAMSCGVVPIITDVSGASDLVQQGHGFLVPQGEDFSKALSQASKLPEAERVAMGQRARQFVEARFSMTGVARQHLALYAALTAGT